MTYEQWQIGLEIQEDGIRALALTARRGALRLRRWWQLPLPHGCLVGGVVAEPEALTAVLRQWRKTLPGWHRLRLGFPAHRTLLRQVPLPTARLSEPECERYIAGAAARQVGVAAETLALDYHPTADGKALSVIAAQQGEVACLMRCARQARLNLTAITPDASAPGALVRHLSAPLRGLVSWHSGKWYLACDTHWGWGEPPAVTTFEQACALLGMAPHDAAWCALPAGVAAPEAQAFDPWRTFTHLQPPLPLEPEKWLVPIGLAVGEAMS